MNILYVNGEWVEHMTIKWLLSLPKQPHAPLVLLKTRKQVLVSKIRRCPLMCGHKELTANNPIMSLQDDCRGIVILLWLLEGLFSTEMPDITAFQHQVLALTCLPCNVLALFRFCVFNTISVLWCCRGYASIYLCAVFAFHNCGLRLSLFG